MLTNFIGNNQPICAESVSIKNSSINNVVTLDDLIELLLCLKVVELSLFLRFVMRRTSTSSSPLSLSSWRKHNEESWDFSKWAKRNWEFWKMKGMNRECEWFIKRICEYIDVEDERKKNRFEIFKIFRSRMKVERFGLNER